MTEQLFEILGAIPNELKIFILSMLPISELRGAIPLAMYLRIPVLKGYFIAVAGNLVPVVPLLLFLSPVSVWLRRFPPWRQFFNWLFKRTENRAEVVQKYEALGLIIFVAIPLPVTGAWTGCVAASIFGIRFRYAFPAIIIGVLIAGVIVTLVSMAGRGFVKFF